jgi:hypothetical protein
MTEIEADLKGNILVKAVYQVPLKARIVIAVIVLIPIYE